MNKRHAATRRSPHAQDGRICSSDRLLRRLRLVNEDPGAGATHQRGAIPDQQGIIRNPEPDRFVSMRHTSTMTTIAAMQHRAQLNVGVRKYPIGVVRAPCTTRVIPGIRIALGLQNRTGPRACRRSLKGCQCAIRTGKVMERNTVREVPPSIHSRARLWP